MYDFDTMDEDEITAWLKQRRYENVFFKESPSVGVVAYGSRDWVSSGCQKTKIAALRSMAHKIQVADQ